MTQRIVFQARVGNIQAYIFHIKWSGNEWRKLRVFACTETENNESREDVFMPDELPDAMHAFSLASAWLRKHPVIPACEK